MRLRLQGQKGPQSLAEAARLARAQPAAVPRSRCTLAPAAALRLLRCWTVAVLPLPTHFVVREGYPKYLCDRVFREFEYQKDDGDNDFIEPDMRSASTSDVRIHPLTGRAAFKTHCKRKVYSTKDPQVMEKWCTRIQLR